MEFVLLFPHPINDSTSVVNSCVVEWASGPFPPERFLLVTIMLRLLAAHYC